MKLFEKIKSLFKRNKQTPNQNILDCKENKKNKEIKNDKTGS